MEATAGSYINSSREPVSTTSCAFDGFRKREDWFSETDYASLSFHRLLFFHWVSYERSLDHKIALTERLTCPFLWCRKQCGGIEALLSHVVKCGYLREGEYWCSLCQKAERISPPLSQLSNPLSESNSPKKSGNLIRKNLVRKAIQLIRKIAPSPTPKLSHDKPFDYTNYSPIIAELENNAPKLQELPDTSSPIGCRQSAVETTVSGGEMYSIANKAQVAGEPDDIELFGHLKATESDLCRLDAGGARDSSGPVIFNIAAADSREREAECVSYNLASWPSDTDILWPSETDLTGPIGPYMLSSDALHFDMEYAEFDTIISLDDEPNAPAVMSQNENAAMEGGQLNLLSDTQGISSVQASSETHKEGASKDHSIADNSTLSLADDLVIISGILYKQIAIKLAQMPRCLSLFRSTLPSEKDILGDGLKVLRNVIEGVGINSAMELHTLLHLACVSSIMTNEYNTGEIFDRISASIVTCSHVLQSHYERSFFTLASEWIWGTSRGQENQTHNVNCSISNDHNSCIQQPPGASGNQSLPTLFSSVFTKISSLQHSWVVQICKQLLATFEYYQLLEGPRGIILGNDSYSAVKYFQDLETPRGFTFDKALYWNASDVRLGSSAIPTAWSQVLKQLMGEFGLEGFDPVIRSVATMIHNEKFMNVREIELKLIHDGRVSISESMQATSWRHLQSFSVTDGTIRNIAAS
ncbi:hypothetical protein MMC11_003392 [Xylographa trunciseda]|nr:hypothetical protein [Xylographa trunciseda]